MSRFRVPHVPASEITPESVWLDRRRWIQRAAALGALAGTGPGLCRQIARWRLV